jgi:CheY-like chemotaxis protein
MMAPNGKRVLVVEDEALVAMLLEDLLADLGCMVIGPAANCAQAFVLLAKYGLPDGAVLDVNLGGEKVFPLADVLVAKKVPFVFTTGYGDGFVEERFTAVEKLSKPFEPRRLQSVLAKQFAF